MPLPPADSKVRPFITAHRGAAGLAPENTLAAIDEALASGVARIEIDVQQSKDGVVVVMHDRTLDRTTNGSGFIGDYSWAELQKLDAGSSFASEFAGESIPSLEQVLQAIDGRAELIVEIKDGKAVYPAIEKHILELIGQYQARDWCMIHSFADAVLEEVHRLDPEFPLIKLYVGTFHLLPAYIDHRFHWGRLDPPDYVVEVGFHHATLTPGVVRRMHNKGLSVNAWTANKPKQWERLRQLGVDGITTDWPERLKIYLAEGYVH